jgi:hypothetical protein
MDVQQSGDEGGMVHLVREVEDKRLQRATLLASAEVFKGVWNPDMVLEEPMCVRFGEKLLLGTYWLSLSTTSPKLSCPSISGTPESSAGHRGVDGRDIVTRTFRRVQFALQP